MAVRDVCDAVSLLFRGQDRSNEITLTDFFTVFLPVSVGGSSYRLRL